MVLVEAISVIVREADIASKYAGGWERFAADVPNPTLCRDGELVRVGFMNPSDVEGYVRLLQKRGLRVQTNGKAVEIAVVDQIRGATVPCDWIELRRADWGGGTVKACALRGSQSARVSVPAGWRFQGSLSQTSGFVPAGAEGKSLEFLRHEDGIDVYRSKLTREEVFIGRAGSAETLPSANDAYKQIESLVTRALDLDLQAEDARAKRDKKAAGRVYSELLEVLLPRAEALAERTATHGSFAHFAHGVVLRVLHEYEAAVMAFERSIALQPDVINTLLEITLCLGTLDRHEEARRYARRAVDVEPGSAAAWGNLAMCLIQSKNKAEAKLAIDKALSLDPTDAKNRYIARNFERYFR